MKITLSETPRRIIPKENKTEGILSWDIDNAYPQRIRIMVKSSGRAMGCIECYARFIEGGGFKDQIFWKAVINSDGLTMDKLLRSLVEDYAILKGFAIHVNWNANFRITEYNFLPFEHTRLPIPEENDLHYNRIAVHSDWARWSGKRFLKDSIEWLHEFNPDPETIQAQVNEAGGWDKYKGQVMWYSATGNKVYPEATLDPVLEDVDTDSQIKIFKNRNVRRGFMDPVMLIHKGKFKDDTERGNFKTDLTKYQGAEKEGNIMLIEVDQDEQIPDIKAFPVSTKDRKFELTEQTIHENIRKCVLAPGVLVSDLVAGRLGTAQEIQDATKYYNGATNKERRLFEETFTRLHSYFAVPAINPSGDFSIIPLSIISEESGQLLVEKLQVGGTQAFTAILSDPLLGAQQKINTLILLFGMAQIDAEALVNGTPLTTAQIE